MMDTLHSKKRRPLGFHDPMLTVNLNPLAKRTQVHSYRIDRYSSAIGQML